MHNQSYKFSFLVSWCILLSISIVTMVAIIIKDSNQMREIAKVEIGTGSGARVDEWRAGSEERSVDYIHLVLGGSETSPWTRSSSCFCDNTSLILQNGSIIITTGGFYHTYAQVTFMDNKAQEGTVTLVANENVPDKTPRKLIETRNGNGTVPMSGVIRLRKGDKVKLNIATHFGMMKEVSKTYWGLFLLLKQDDK